MNYLAARNIFLIGIGCPEGEDRERAIEVFDRTLIAAHARFLDAWAAFWENLRP